MLQSSFGNLELLAVERVGSERVQLTHWFRHDADPNRQFNWFRVGVLPGSDQVNPYLSVPAFIQSAFRSEGAHGSFEVLAPAAGGGLLHWFWDHSPRRGWEVARPIDPGGRVVRGVHFIQGTLGTQRNNFEVVAETGEEASLNNPGVGFGTLLSYFCDNEAATTSDNGVWAGPFPIPG